MLVVCFAGNVTKDPEKRTTQTGKDVVYFSVAINQGKDKTEFINCVAWEGTARLIEQYVSKGDRLSGSGTLQTRSWEDSQGNKRYTTEVIVREFDFPPKRNSAPKQDDLSFNDIDNEISF